MNLRSVGGGESAEDFNSSGNGNDYGGGGKVCTGVYIYAYREDVMGSYNKS